MSRKSVIKSLFLAAALIVGMLPVVAGAQTVLTSNNGVERRVHTVGSGDSRYDYELWSQYGQGNSTLTVRHSAANGGAFDADWRDTHNFLARSGRNWGQSNPPTVTSLGTITLDFEGTWSSNDGARMFGVYGWGFFAQGQNPTRDENGTQRNYSNQIEYYIIYDRGGFNPASGGVNARRAGTGTIDGIAWEYWVADRINQPMLTGNGNFKQYFSVMANTSNHRTRGLISVSRHFEEWRRVGMPMHTLYEVAMKVESYTGRPTGALGNARVTKNVLCTGNSCGGSTPSGFTLTTIAEPTAGGQINRNPNNANSVYTSGQQVTVTAAPATGWRFDGWSGAVTGTTSPATVTMSADRTVTARFRPTADGTVNYIRDGNFPGSSLTSNWSLGQGEGWGNSAATASVASGNATINITRTGTNRWEPQLTQAPIELINGMHYRLTFTARAAANRVIEAQFGGASDPWPTYAEQRFDLTTTNQNFTMNFTMSNPTDLAAQFAFNMGQATGNVIISNVRLIHVLNPTTSICPKNNAVSSSVRTGHLRVKANKSVVDVAFQAQTNGMAEVRLYSLKGELAGRTNLRTVAGQDYSHTFDTKNLSNGIYIVSVRDGGRTVQSRVTVF